MQNPATQKPALIVVTGEPGAGKTTLAWPLSQALRCPRISRDEIKEGLIRSAGPPCPPGDEIARCAYETFFDTLGLLLDRRVTVIAEAAFQHKVWAPKLQRLLGIARVCVIVCRVDPELARSRRVQRSTDDPERLQFHPDPMAAVVPYDPPHLDVPTLTVDTSGDYVPSFAQILAFARNGST